MNVCVLGSRQGVTGTKGGREKFVGVLEGARRKQMERSFKGNGLEL